MVLSALIILVCVVQEPSIDELIRQLDSDQLSQREEAQRKLQSRIREAKPSLEKAAQRGNPELAARAKRLLDVAALLDREKLTPELEAELPGLADALLAKGNPAWLAAFLEQSSKGKTSLKPDTWAFLAPRAARAANTVEDRMKVCNVLAILPVPEASPELLRYFLEPVREFGDPDDMLRTAITAMSLSKSTKDLLRVVIEYNGLPRERVLVNPNIVSDAFRALVKLDARTELLELARQEESYVAGEAVEELSGFGDPRNLAELLKLLQSKNPYVRYQAALAMGRWQVQEAKPALRAMLADPDGPAIRGALAALARLGDREEVPRILKFVDDDRSWVQVAAMDVLAEFDATQAVPALRGVLSHENPAVRAMAAQSLGRLGGREAGPLLLPLLRDKEAIVTLYAATGLCSAGSAKGLPVLVRLAEKRENLYLHLNVSDRMMSGGYTVAPPPLLSLNALRSPDSWSRYRKASVPAGSAGTLLPDAELLAKVLGLTLQLSPEVSAMKQGLDQRRYFDLAPRKPLSLHLMLFLFSELHFEVVFDGPAMRLMTRTEALSAWKRWYLEQAPTDDDDRAVAAAFKEELRREALPAAEREALEARDKTDARALHRKERAKALNGVLTPRLRKYEERLLDGSEDTWAEIGREILAKQGRDVGLTEADLDVLIPRAAAAIKNTPNQLEYKKTDERVALLRLAKPRTGPEIPTWIHDQLQDPEFMIRSTALTLLNPKLHGKEILGFSKDASSLVRLTVANLLTETHPAECLALMIDLSLDKEWGVSDRAAMYLQYRAGPDQIPHMIKLLKRSTSNSQAADAALSYLGRQGAREAIPAIVPLLDEEQGRCAPQAVQVLLELGARESLPRVLGVLRKSKESQYLAVPLIEAFDVREAVPDLYRLIDGPDPHFQQGKVVLALARMGDRAAEPAIRRLLQAKPEFVRVQGCNALAFLDGVASRKTILEAFKDRYVTPLDALVILDARETIPELSKRLGDMGPELIPTLVDLDAREALPQIFAVLQPGKGAAYYMEGLRAVARGYPKESLPTLQVNFEGKTSWAPYPASLLCEAGSSQGFPLLIEQKWLPVSLNALRAPEPWQKLRDLRLAGTLYGSCSQLLERVAREAGLRVEGLPADAKGYKAWTGRHVFIPKAARPLRLVDIIDRLEDPYWSFIVEKDVIRVLPRDAALQVWSEWWASAPKK